MDRPIFVEGKKYKVKCDFTNFGGTFYAGEVLVFISGKYSPYDDSFAYEFQAADGSSKSWWLHQTEPADRWKDYFKPVGLFG